MRAAQCRIQWASFDSALTEHYRFLWTIMHTHLASCVMCTHITDFTSAYWSQKDRLGIYTPGTNQNSNAHAKWILHTPPILCNELDRKEEKNTINEEKPVDIGH